MADELTEPADRHRCWTSWRTMNVGRAMMWPASNPLDGSDLSIRSAGGEGLAQFSGETTIAGGRGRSQAVWLRLAPLRW